MKTKPIFKILYLCAVLGVVAALFFLFKDIIFEVIRYTKAGDQEGLKTFIESKGVIGGVAIVAIEALEMVVICIPAEFIQIPAGLSFQFIYAVILCDAGVILGATIIYFIVNILKIKPAYVEKQEKKILEFEKISTGERTQLLMYFLFVTPIIPFGAICYYASTKKINYFRYIFTCATGVLPSICTSILMGVGVKYFIGNEINIWLFLLLVVAMAALLLFGMYVIAKKLFFKDNQKHSPYSFVYSIATKLYGIVVKLHSRAKYVYDEKYEELLDLSNPIMFMANHTSPYDIYHVAKFIAPYKAIILYNAWYNRGKLATKSLNAMGFISKKMFCAEPKPIIDILRALKKGYSISMYPEARLSLDGTNSPLTPGTEHLVKKLNCPVVLLNIHGAYSARSKVRTCKGKVPVEIKINRIMYPEEYHNMSEEEIRDAIVSGIHSNEYEYMKNHNMRVHLAANGLESVLYRCPKCGHEYSMHPVNNKLICRDCYFTLEVDNHNSFKENELGFKNLHEAYTFIKEQEKEKIDFSKDVIFSQEVDICKMSLTKRRIDAKGTGVCTIYKDGFGFKGTLNGEEVEFKNSLEEQFAIAFGVADQYECYFNGELYYFYPHDNKNSCTKVSTIYDLVQENRQGK